MAIENYFGNCHCEAIKFELKVNLSTLIRCDCSMCSRKGALMAYPDQHDFKLLQGIDALSCYQFNTRTAKHYFCQYCGIYTHHIPRSLPDKIGVNVACLTGVDISAFDVKQVSGAQLS